MPEVVVITYPVATVAHMTHSSRQPTGTLLLLGALVFCEAHVVPSVRGRLVQPTRPASMLVAASPATPPENAKGLAVAWGVCGFLSILASAIRRLAPIALQPVVRRDLSALQWVFYGATMGGFAYVEGYGAFQKKFSPLVVQRAMTLKQGGSPLQVALAPFYSMGLFHASRKRKIVSWSITLSVAVIVGVVKRLPYPWRSIVDAGVCTGLCWGGASIVAFYARAICGRSPGVDPALPA